MNMKTFTSEDQTETLIEFEFLSDWPTVFDVATAQMFADKLQEQRTVLKKSWENNFVLLAWYDTAITDMDRDEAIVVVYHSLAALSPTKGFDVSISYGQWYFAGFI